MYSNYPQTAVARELAAIKEQRNSEQITTQKPPRKPKSDNYYVGLVAAATTIIAGLCWFAGLIPSNF